MQKSDVLLEIRNIQASYKEYPALNNVSLDIKKNTGIIENIIYFGLNRKTEDIITRADINRKSIK